MKSVCVCRSCGKTIDSEYIYCPWCGCSRLAQGARGALDTVFLRLEEKQAIDRESRVRRLEQELSVLEKDLDMFVLGAEMRA